MAVTIIRIPKVAQLIAPAKPFRPMLAASEIPTVDQLRFPLMASFKLDGMRCTAHNGVAMSRTMIPFPNRFVQEYFKEHALHLNGFDGELIVGKPYGEDTMYRCTSGINSQGGEPDFTWWVFDRFTMDGYTAQARSKQVEAAIEIMADMGLRVRSLQQHWVTCIEELQDLYEQAIEYGYEGLILKNPNGLYKNGRASIKSGELLKWKIFIHRECRIIAVVQGQKNLNEDKRSNTGYAKRSTAKAGKVLVEEVGSFLVQCLETGVTFNCGPGVLTDPQLADLWKRRIEITDAVFTYKSQKSGVKDKPRFPGFHAWRPGYDFDAK